MKKFIALAVLATSTVSFAASSDIYDIMYLPSPGTTYGSTSYSMVNSKLEAEDVEDEIDGHVITQTIGHAFTDRLSVQASINHADLEYDPEVGEKYDLASGISDPTLSARFRTMDENARWDILGGATISLGDSEIKSDGDTDNLQGGHSLFIGTQYGVKSESMQWAVSAILTHNMEATVDDKEIDEEYDNDAHNSLKVRGDLLNKLAEKSLLRSHLSVDFTEEFDQDFDSDTTYPSNAVWEIGTEYQHLFSQDLLARVGVDYQMNNFRTGQIDDWNTWIFTVGANYQF